MSKKSRDARRNWANSVYRREEHESKNCRYENCRHVASNRVARDTHEVKHHDGEKKVVEDGRRYNQGH